MLLRLLLFLLLPACALAQPCDCCKIRDLGQQKYNAGDYRGAKSTWETAKKMTDAAKCTDLDALITKAKQKIPSPPPPKSKKNTPPKPKVSATSEAEEQAWKYAQGTSLGCQRYLKDYPEGKYVKEARQCEKDYSDDDGDGIINKNDACPSEKGAATDSGCPPPKPASSTANNGKITPSPVTHGKKSGLTMVPVEGGAFTMGSPENEADRYLDECQHRVTVNPFSIGQYEVTQADWYEVMGTNPSSFKNCDDCPVENVSWNDAQEFIKAANRKYGRNFRLPTEAEWEYAARGGKKSQGWRYSGSSSLDEVAWYRYNADKKTHAVGLKKANELGLYDMSGNVWEWCSDQYGPYPGCAEPKEIDKNSRVLRGGSWDYNVRNCRVSNRGRITPVNRDNGVGFRLAQD
jgi:formylglycine-generating enzyme required for sulfatase activity